MQSLTKRRMSPGRLDALLRSSAMVYRRLAALPGGGVPTPELLYEGEEFIVLSLIEGEPWDKVDDRLPAAARTKLRRGLGAITARLHTLAAEDGRFGYPAARSALSAPDWRAAFTAMVEALLDDAEPWRAPLGVPPGGIRRLVSEGADALDEVAGSRLVHFDLWPGNIFVDPGGGPAGDSRGVRVTGLIDHERAFWGDPAAELVSLGFGGDAGPGSDLVAGYTEVGGTLDFGPAFRHRLALYDLYLSVLLVTECGPRGFGSGHLAFCRGRLTGSLAALRALG